MRTTALTVEDVKAKLTRYIQICLQMAEMETDEEMAQAHLKDAQEALVKYRVLTSPVLSWACLTAEGHVVQRFHTEAEADEFWADYPDDIASVTQL